MADSGSGAAHKAQPVLAFLKRHGLQVLSTAIVLNGFDDLDTLAAMSDGDLRALGISDHYAVRLRRGLQELLPQEDPIQANPVVAFLEEHGLGKYAQTLVSSGFDEMSTLLEIEDADLKDLGVPRGHAVKLRRHLREYTVKEYAEEDRQESMTRPMRQEKQLAPQGGQQHRGSDRVPPSAAPSRSASQVHLEATQKMKGDVERSWDQVQQFGTSVVGELLYKHTFALAPQAMDLFPKHVLARYREWNDPENVNDNAIECPALRKLFFKVVDAVGCAVAGIQDAASLAPMLIRLGGRHVGYRVPPSYWPVLGKALNMTLHELLGADFTPNVEKAWTVVYSFMSSIMIQGLTEAKHAMEREEEDADSVASQSTKGRAEVPRLRLASDASVLSTEVPRSRIASDFTAVSV